MNLTAIQPATSSRPTSADARSSPTCNEGTPGEVVAQPVHNGITYTHLSARQIKRHWALRGRTRRRDQDHT
jgi:hypothetical protein